MEPTRSYIHLTCSYCETGSEDIPIYPYVYDGAWYGVCVDCYHEFLNRKEVPS